MLKKLRLNLRSLIDFIFSYRVMTISDSASFLKHCQQAIVSIFYIVIFCQVTHEHSVRVFKVYNIHNPVSNKNALLLKRQKAHYSGGKVG